MPTMGPLSAGLPAVPQAGEGSRHYRVDGASGSRQAGQSWRALRGCRRSGRGTPSPPGWPGRSAPRCDRPRHRPGRTGVARSGRTRPSPRASQTRAVPGDSHPATRPALRPGSRPPSRQWLVPRPPASSTSITTATLVAGRNSTADRLPSGDQRARPTPPSKAGAHGRRFCSRPGRASRRDWCGHRRWQPVCVHRDRGCARAAGWPLA